MNSTTNNISPAFVCGMPRSGTTLLMSLLDGHSQLLVFAGESRFFERFWNHARKISDPQQRLMLAEKTLLHLFQGYYHQKFLSHISYDEVRACFLERLQGQPEHLGAYLEAVVLAYGEVSQMLTAETCHWLDKTPWTERFATHIYRWWPETRCIHMIRDPRDVYLSWQQRAERNTVSLDVDYLAYSWLITSHHLRKNLRAYGPERYLSIRYEDLVTDAKGALNKLTQFLNIRAEEHVYQPTKSGTTWAGNSASHTPLSGISQNAVGKWQHNLSEANAEKLAILESIIAKDMNYYGYTPQFPLEKRLRAKTGYIDLRVKARIVRDLGRY